MGCGQQHFTQVEFYVSSNFPKFNSIQFFFRAQEKFQKYAWKCTIKRLRAPSTYFCRPSRVLQLFHTGCKIRFHDFFKSAPAVKNLRKSGSYCNYKTAAVRTSDVGELAQL